MMLNCTLQLHDTIALARKELQVCPASGAHDWIRKKMIPTTRGDRHHVPVRCGLRGQICVTPKKKNILPLPFHQWTQKNTKQENTSLPLGPAKRPPTRGTAATAKLKRSKNWIIFYFRLRSDCATCVCVEEDRSREFGRKSKRRGRVFFFWRGRKHATVVVVVVVDVGLFQRHTVRVLVVRRAFIAANAIAS